MKRALFWFSLGTLGASAVVLTFADLNPKEHALFAIACMGSLLYLLHVTSQSVDQKFKAVLLEILDQSEEAELHELRYLLDELQELATEPDSEACIATTRTNIECVVKDIQNERRRARS